MTEKVEYGLVIAFPDQSPAYVYGFEAGSLWECFRRGVQIERHQVHAANRQLLLRMATHFGLCAHFEPVSVDGEVFPDYLLFSARKTNTLQLVVNNEP